MLSHFVFCVDFNGDLKQIFEKENSRDFLVGRHYMLEHAKSFKLTSIELSVECSLYFTFLGHRIPRFHSTKKALVECNGEQNI